MRPLAKDPLGPAGFAGTHGPLGRRSALNSPHQAQHLALAGNVLRLTPMPRP